MLMKKKNSLFIYILISLLVFLTPHTSFAAKADKVKAANSKNVKEIKAVLKKPVKQVDIKTPYQNSLLLLIGISAYKEFPFLNYPVEDVKYIEGKIGTDHFNKIIAIKDADATKANIIKGIKSVLHIDTNDKSAVVYDRVVILFTGRSSVKDDKGYLIAADTSPNNIEGSAISTSELKTVLSENSAQHVLFIIDSNLSNLDAVNSSTPPYYTNDEDIKSALSKDAVQVISSGKTGEQMDLYGSRSIFVNEFVNALSGDGDKNLDGIMTASEIGSYLSGKVTFESNNSQSPHFGRWEGEGEMIFKVGTRDASTQKPLYEMVFVAGGEIKMGSPGMVGRNNERPVHTVYIKPFYIGKYEVTNQEYKQFVEATKHREPEGFGNPLFNGDLQPVVGVTWGDAKSFCGWIGKRLPTEAEWEKGAHGNEWKRYPWGDEEGGLNKDDKANINNVMEKTSQVEKYQKGISPFGAYDMAGNVWEWVNDWYSEDYYKVSPKENPEGPASSENENAKVLRGGGWKSSGFNARTSYRNWLNADYTNIEIGIRCAD